MVVIWLEMEATNLESNPKNPEIKIVLPGKDPESYDKLLNDLEDTPASSINRVRKVVEAKSTEYLGEVYQAAYQWYYSEDARFLSVLKTAIGRHQANEEILAILDTALAARENRKENQNDTARG